MRLTGRYPETSGLSREQGQAPRRDLFGPSVAETPWEKESPPLLLGEAGSGAGNPPLGPPGIGVCPGAPGIEASARFAEVPTGEVPVAGLIPKRLKNPQPSATAEAGREVSAIGATNVSPAVDVGRVSKGRVVERVVGALSVVGALVAIRLTAGVLRPSRLMLGRPRAGRLTAGVLRPSRLMLGRPRAGRLTAGVLRPSRLMLGRPRAGRLTAGVLRPSRLMLGRPRAGRLTAGVLRPSRLMLGRPRAGRLTAGVLRPSRLMLGRPRAGRLTAGVLRPSRLMLGRLRVGRLMLGG